MIEHFANQASDFLKNACGPSDTTITVKSTAKFSATPFRMRLGTELMFVNSLASGTTYNVTRAIEGTSAIAHPVNALVQQVLTAGALADGVAPAVIADRVLGRKGDDSSFESRHLARTLIDFGADPTGVANCDTAIANYIAYLIANPGKPMLIPSGIYRIEHPIDLRASALKGLLVQGESSNPYSSIFGTGAVLAWHGATSTDDIILLGQPTQQLRNLSFQLYTSARHIVVWQRNSVVVSGMTSPHFHGLTAHCGGGAVYQCGIAITPDSPYSSDYNHDYGKITDCTFNGFTVAGVKNFNASGQAYGWVCQNCIFWGTASGGNTCYGVYWASGGIQVKDYSCVDISTEVHNDATPWCAYEGGLTESASKLYSTGSGATAITIHLSRRRWAIVRDLGAFVPESSQYCWCSDGFVGPRLFSQVYVEQAGTGDPRNLEVVAGNTTNSGKAWTYLANVFPNVNPYIRARMLGHPEGQAEVTTIGSTGRVPAGYTDALLAQAHSFKTVSVRDPQNAEDPWLIDPHKVTTSLFLVGGPRLLPTGIYAYDVHISSFFGEWLSEDNYAGAQPSTLVSATGRCGILWTTQTGYPQLIVGDGRIDAPTSPAGAEIADRAGLNPGTSSFFIACVVRATTAALGGSAYQCAIGKGASTDGPSATNWSCMIDPSGHPVLRWGRSSAEQYVASSITLTDQKDTVIIWGVDRENNEIVYATNVGWNVVERHAFTPTTEVFLNTNKVQIGFDAAGANIFKGGVTMAVMHVGAFSDRKIKHHIWQVARRMGLAVV